MLCFKKIRKSVQGGATKKINFPECRFFPSLGGGGYISLREWNLVGGYKQGGIMVNANMGGESVNNGRRQKRMRCHSVTHTSKNTEREHPFPVLPATPLQRGSTA